MSYSNLPEPPTKATLADARRELEAHRECVRELSARIQDAEDTLARIVEESQGAIREMHRERATLEERVALTLAYISPIRQLPHELLRHIFLLNFEEYPCCAWVLSAVCSVWRALVLSMPHMWSKIRLVTTQTTSADTIRLWLERSGRNVPLDIEIFLRSQPMHQMVIESSRRRISSPSHPLLEPWYPAGAATPPGQLAHIGHVPATTTYVHVPQTHVHVLPIQTTQQLLITNGVVAAAGHGQDDIWLQQSSQPERSGSQQRSRKNMHWGHIAFFYLVEQMHRWERFVFRFDKHFSSVNALKTIEGDAPLLREFEVSCAEPVFCPEWKWLPCAGEGTKYNISNMQALTLHHLPFNWTAPMLQNLRSLSLHTLPTLHLALDRILRIIRLNPRLESLSLYFASPNPPVLPLEPVTLPELKVLSLGGHYLLLTLVESLVLPSLDNLVLDIESRDPIEDTISSLLTRSHNPPLTRLSVSYNISQPVANNLYYSSTGVASWHFLGELDHLHALQLGCAPYEPLLAMLDAPDDDGQDHWVCPNLVALAMRACHHTHPDGVAKLVQMVEARNPDIAAGPSLFTASAMAPARLRQLELYDCTVLGPDVIKWLRTRVDDVVCTEPAFEG
ncbi:hypothetical protein B0H21DRAFT_749640 [Amylocystis lapponica]|nr:hypothetical protein B0H21DRAFT_749640 [Amylocystis lapponica]